jgi:hypothetical protein
MIDSGKGITGHITALGHEPYHYTIFYVEADDVQVCIDKAASVGRKTLVPPAPIPTGTFAWIQDPEETRSVSGSRQATNRTEALRGDYAARSKMPAAPMPPPTHMVTKP